MAILPTTSWQATLPAHHRTHQGARCSSRPLRRKKPAALLGVWPGDQTGDMRVRPSIEWEFDWNPEQKTAHR
jgi:hypothetical protein